LVLKKGGLHYDDAEYGGYHKTSKTKKVVMYPKNGRGKNLHIAEDFHESVAKPFSTKNWNIHKSLIWIDNLKKWW